MSGLWDRLAAPLRGALHRLTLRRWRQARRRAAAGTAGSAQLRRERMQSRALRAALRGFEAAADTRLAAPRQGARAIAAPPGSDWQWRPDAWTDPAEPPSFAPAQPRDHLGHAVSVHHDCPLGEVIFAQHRAAAPDAPAPFALALDAFHFDGRFLSLAIGLPGDAAAGLRRSHILRVTAALRAAPEVPLLARLNLRRGPNTEQIDRPLLAGRGTVTAEFDLSRIGPGDRPVEAAWLDLILTRPAMRRLVIDDLTFARYPRADF